MGEVGSAAKRQELGVFEQIDAVKERLAEIRSRAERAIVYPINRDEALWLAERVQAVLDAITDGHVTYGYVGPGGTNGTPMHVERDALARALYTGGHDAKP